MNSNSHSSSPHYHRSTEAATTGLGPCRAACRNESQKRVARRFTPWLFIFAVSVCFALPIKAEERSSKGASVVEFYGYSDCIELKNETTRVVLCPAAGGRVLLYALQGENALYLPAGDEGWTWDGSQTRGNMNAGRFDIGPEQIVPQRNKLWQGEWTGEIVGPRTARLSSPVDEGPGVSLVREFRLSPKGSRLDCTQTIINATDKPVEYCHWSRTFAVGKGIAIVPLSEHSKFTEGFVRYDPPGKMLNMKPVDEAVQRSGEYLVIGDRPKNPKLGFDSMRGWLAYHTPSNLLFVKKFATFPDRAYNEVAGLTISIWYPEGEMVELEPIGPRQRLESKGDQASFTETWYLVQHPFPKLDNVDPIAIDAIVTELE